MDIDLILEEIKKELFGLNKENTLDSEFQNPIKTDYKNIGDFGVVNKTHPNGHQGIDIAAPKGTYIYPLTDGVVSRVANEAKGGLAVYINHSNGYRSFYTHLNSANVKVGDKVTKNTVIGTVGNSGNARGTSPHVHFQVWKNNQIINPATLFDFKKYNT